MKKSKMLRRLAALLMAGTMMAAMSTGVFADETTDSGSTSPANVTITKELTKGVNDYAPNTTFNFSIAPGTAVDATANSDAIYSGPEGGAAIAEGITSAPKASDIGNETITVGTTNITINNTKFTAPGIYRYVVTETEGNYEGVAYSTETKYFDVYVNSEGNVYSYAFVNPENTKVKDDGVFTNAYGTADKPVSDLTISKTVAGNQGDKTKDFTFTIEVDGTSGEQYYVNNGKTLVSGVPVDITLKDGESVIIYGLSASDTYTVTETDYTADGYTTTIDTVKTNTKTGTISADATVAFVNTKNATTPTGIVMNIAPYVLMVAVAAVLAVVFLRKRNTFEN